MRIGITSDLHYGITTEDQIEKIASEMSQGLFDVIAILGDVGESLNAVGRFGEVLGAFNKYFPDFPPERKLVLAGNHDLWRTRGQFMSSLDLYEDILPQQAKEHGWIWMRDTPMVYPDNGVGIAGNIGWCDYSASDITGASHLDIKRMKYRYVADARYMDSGWDDLTFSDQCREEVLSQLETLRLDSRVYQTILLTHHPIHPVQRVRLPDDVLGVDPFFYNFGLGDAIFNSKKDYKVSQVISGHTHRGLGDTGSYKGTFFHVVPSDYNDPKFISVFT